MKLNELWNFMQVDMAASNFENQMRQAPNRQKLLKQRNVLTELQTNMKKLESDIAIMADRIEAVKDEYTRLEANLKALIEQIESNPPDTLEAIEKQAQAVQKVTDALTRYEHELQKMRKDADARDRQQKEIRVRAAKTKMEYDALKKDYDVEFKRDSEQLTAMKAKVEESSRAVEPELLAKYKEIKQHIQPPMSKLINDQCSGCFMSLPSATLSRVKGNEIVICDNCGRILYNED